MKSDLEYIYMLIYKKANWTGYAKGNETSYKPVMMKNNIWHH